MANQENNTIQILDKTLKHGFSPMPRAVLRDSSLSMQAKTLYALLLDYAWQKGSCFPGQLRLSNDLGVHVNTILKYLGELKGYGLINWKRRGFNKTNIYYILPLGNVSDKKACDSQEHVNHESQKDVSPFSQGSMNKVEEEGYKKNEYKKSLTLGNDTEELNLESFDLEAIALARELNDEKSIKYYQKLINQKRRGEISDENIQIALNDTRRMVRTDQVDGTHFLKNPAAWFVSILKRLSERQKEKQKQEKVKSMLDDFKTSFLSKSKL